MKCPHCGTRLISLGATEVTTADVVGIKAGKEAKLPGNITVKLAVPEYKMSPITVIILTCPSCEAILGAVNKPER